MNKPFELNFINKIKNNRCEHYCFCPSIFVFAPNFNWSHLIQFHVFVLHELFHFSNSIKKSKRSNGAHK